MTASDESFDDMSTNLLSAESSGELGGRLTNPLAPVRKTSMLCMNRLNQCIAESKEYLMGDPPLLLQTPLYILD